MWGQCYHIAAPLALFPPTEAAKQDENGVLWFLRCFRHHPAPPCSGTSSKQCGGMAWFPGLRDWLAHCQAAVHLPPGQRIDTLWRSTATPRVTPLSALELTLYTFPFKIQLRGHGNSTVMTPPLWGCTGQGRERMTPSCAGCYRAERVQLDSSVTKQQEVDFSLSQFRLRGVK